jgi:hypothetical protein
MNFFHMTKAHTWEHNPTDKENSKLLAPSNNYPWNVSKQTSHS